jgi:nitroreductase
MSSQEESIPPEYTAAADWLLSTTRAVRKRLDLDRPVEPEVLLQCIQLAVQAPTGSNAQGWRWVVISDPSKRARVGEYYRAAARARIRARGPAAPQDPREARVRDSVEHLVEVIDRVPVLVIPCVEGTPGSTQHPASFYGSILPAVWSFALALRSRGLGSAWTTIHLTYEREVGEELGIPDTFSQVALLPVAYTLGTRFRPAARPPADQITYWDGWGRAR